LDLCFRIIKAAVFLSGSGFYPKVDCRDNPLGWCGYVKVSNGKSDRQYLQDKTTQSNDMGCSPRSNLKSPDSTVRTRFTFPEIWAFSSNIS
jgi:hypothetical protein